MHIYVCVFSPQAMTFQDFFLLPTKLTGWLAWNLISANQLEVKEAEN